MKSLLKYRKAFEMGFQSAMEYRADFLMSLFSGGFIIIIQCFLWTAVFASSPDAEVYGYTFPEMIAYSILAGLVAKIVSTGFEWEIASDIKNGGLSKFIVQPIGYFYYRICAFFGRKVLQLGIVFVIALAALFACNVFLGLLLDWSRVLLFLPFVFLSMVINFLIYYCLSSLAFIMAEVWGVFVAAGQGILMLSGGIFPLDVFGDKAARVLSVLPFQYIVFYPVNIVNGRLSLEQILQGALIQVVWIGLLIVAANFCWKAGMKKYVAVGG